MGTMLASLRSLLSCLDTSYSRVLELNSFSYSAVFTNVPTLISRPLRTLLRSPQETQSPMPGARKLNLDSASTSVRAEKSFSWYVHLCTISKTQIQNLH